jgi:uncharacterized membrane protein
VRSHLPTFEPTLLFKHENTAKGDDHVSHLIALVFDDQFRGDEARAALHRMVGEGLLQIEDSVLITRKPGEKTTVSQEDKVNKEGQKTGHLLGLVTAAITGTFPFIIAGTLAGRLVGRLMDYGVTNKFIKTVKNETKSGSSALIVLGESDPERRQKISERLQTFGVKVVESDIPSEMREEIEKDIQTAA